MKTLSQVSACFCQKEANCLHIQVETENETMMTMIATFTDNLEEGLSLQVTDNQIQGNQSNLDSLKP